MIRFYQAEGMRHKEQFTWSYIGKNVSPDKAIGSARPACCWGNIGEHWSPSNEEGREDYRTAQPICCSEWPKHTTGIVIIAIIVKL